MKKRFLVLLMSVAMTVSAFAGGNTLTVRAESDSSKSETPSIDGKTYYYDQFENDAYKSVYDSIAEAAYKFHNSTANASQYVDINEKKTYTAFTVNVSKQDWDVINSGGLDRVIHAFYADHPEYFWLIPDCTYQAVSNGEKGSVFYQVSVYCYEDYANGNSRQVIKNNMDIEIANYVAKVSADAHDYEKEYTIHNEIIDNIYYNTEADAYNSKDYWAGTIDGVFNTSHKSATSFGYAKAFKAVMDQLDVPCVYIQGNPKQSDETKDAVTYDSHAWNAVYIGGEWYLVDLANDDPITTTGKDVLKYDYFNVTTEHAPDLVPNKDFLSNIPDCTGTTYSVDKIREDLEDSGIWTKANYNFFDKILDKYGVSVVLISIGIIIILLVILIKKIHARRIKSKQTKIKNTKVTVIESKELDEQLRRPPL